MAARDLTYLLSILQKSGLQMKDQPLYQVISELIKELSSLSINTDGGTHTGPAGPAGIDGLTIPGLDGFIDGSNTISGPINASNLPLFTAGSVVFAGPSGFLAQDNANFYWDDTNNRLGILTNSPQFALDVNGNIVGHAFITAYGDSGSIALAAFNTTIGGNAFSATTLGHVTIQGVNVDTSGVGLTIVQPPAGGATWYPLAITSAGGSAGDMFVMVPSGNSGFGVAPTARLHLHAGSTVANTAPLKFNSGSLLTAPEVGAIEFLTDRWYGTITTGTSRQTFAFLSDVAGTHTLTGTSNQVILSAAGTNSLLGSNDITLSLPQNIATTSTPQFATLGLGVAASASTVGYFLSSTLDQLWLAYDSTHKTIFNVVNTGGMNISPQSGADVSLVTASTGAINLTSGGITSTIAISCNLNSITSGSGLYVQDGLGTLTSGKLVDIQVSGTAGLTNQTGLNILTTGANANAGQTTYGAKISNTHSTNTSTNVALSLNASSGATANYALVTSAGNVGISNTAPGSLLSIGTAAVSRGVIELAGNTSGTLIFQAPSTASGTLTLPAGTTDFSSTGGTGQVVQQASAGAAFTVGTVSASNLSGTLGVANGGTGTGTAFTAGSVVYAGASGVYSQDNANFFWDATNHRLGIGTVTPAQQLDILSTVARMRMTNTTGSAKSMIIEVNNSKANFYEAAGSAGDILSFDLTNKRVGIATSSPIAAFEINQRMRLITTGTDPASGEGLEIFYNASTHIGAIFSYDRGGGAFKEVDIDGIPIKLNVTAAAGVVIGAATGGDKGTGTLNTAGVYYANGTAGISTTVTSASLVGKTITFTNGLITGFA